MYFKEHENGKIELIDITQNGYFNKSILAWHEWKTNLEILWKNRFKSAVSGDYFHFFSNNFILWINKNLIVEREKDEGRNFSFSLQTIFVCHSILWPEFLFLFLNNKLNKNRRSRSLCKVFNKVGNYVYIVMYFDLYRSVI